jgi:hypothetical protein
MSDSSEKAPREETERVGHRRPMTRQFEELDYRTTSLGERKKVRMLNDEIIYEVKLDEGSLMSSLFTPRSSGQLLNSARSWAPRGGIYRAGESGREAKGGVRERILN